MKPLNILAIVPYPFLPPTCGGDYSSMRLFNYLGKQNNVTLFTCEPFSPVDHLHFDFNIISYVKFKPQRYVNFFLVFDLLKIIRKNKIEAVFMEQPWFWGMAFFLKLLSRKPFVMRSNNIEYLRFKSIGKWWWWFLFVYERWCLRSMDFVFFVSEEDRQRAISAFGIRKEKTTVTPYGVEVETPKTDFSKEKKWLRDSYHILPDEKILLFFGSLDYPPNIEALDMIIDHILPLLNKQANEKYKLMVCGRRAQERLLNETQKNTQIIVAGFVDNIDDYIAGADLVLNPILSGGGIKTKAVDALALNKIVISTETGAEGIDPSLCGKNLIVIADRNWDKYVDAIIHHVNEQPVISESFYSHFSWTGIAKTMSEIIKAMY